MPKPEQITTPSGRTLHRWTDKEGRKWACAAYDHGPFCRLCQPVDGVVEALLQNVMDGLQDVKTRDGDGELMFSVTEEGMRRVRHMLSSTKEEK